MLTFCWLSLENSRQKCFVGRNETFMIHILFDNGFYTVLIYHKYVQQISSSAGRRILYNLNLLILWSDWANRSRQSVLMIATNQGSKHRCPFGLSLQLINWNLFNWISKKRSCIELHVLNYKDHHRMSIKHYWCFKNFFFFLNFNIRL